MSSVSSRVPVGYRFYWDDQCKLCNSLKNLATALDWSGRVTFVPIVSDPGEVDLGHMDWEERLASSHLVEPDGRVRSAGAGILGLASLLPLTAPFAFLFKLLPRHEVLLEKLYRLVASNRGVPYGGSCKVDFGEPEE